MKNPPVAWLVTHDAYIDRRILFFADVLLENGYTVKLFPSAYTNFMEDADPDYVVRPLDWTVVKLYGLKTSALMENERALIESVIDAQTRYHASTGYYAPAASALPNFKQNRAGYRLSTVGDRSGFYAMIMTGQRFLTYDSRTGAVTVVTDKRVAELSREYERAIVKADLETVDFEGRAVYGDIAVTYAKGPRGEGLAAHCRAADNGIWLFNNDPPELYRGTPIPYAGLHKDTLMDREFDFEEYRKVLYDFSPILEQVKRSLATEQPDLVYVADLPTLPIGIMLKEALGCKLIVDCHEWWYKQARLWEKDMPHKIDLAERSEAELYPQCDVCITVGKYLAQDMSNTYHKPFEVIYSCMSADLSLNALAPQEGFWDQYGIPRGSRVAIFQGSMTDLRNLDNLARATRNLPENCYLAVVGGGPYEETFRKVLAEEGNPERVVMVGWVNQSELLNYTVNADLGVLPYSAMDEYFSYSVPNKLMEYFEAAVPMLYDLSMKEISMVAGEHGVGVAEDLSDPDKFGKTLCALMNDPQRLAEMKARYEGCRGKFSYASQKKAFEEILEKNDLLTR